MPRISNLRPLCTMASKSVTWCDRFVNINNFANNGRNVKLSNIYLRDNSKEKDSFNMLSKQRIHDSLSLDLNVRPEKAFLESERLVVNWDDGHTSCYPFDWLNENVLGERQSLSNGVPRVLWNRETMSKADNRFDYSTVLKEKDSLTSVYKSLIQYGLVFVTGCPKNPESSVSISQRIATVMWNREYHFGGHRPYLTLTNDGANADFDIGYTNAELPMHTDNPDLVEPAGLLTLQPIQQSNEGGKSAVVDGYLASQIMREKYPKEFKTLTSLRVNHLQGLTNALNPLISLDPDTKEPMTIRYNNANIDSWQPEISQEQMHEWYHASSIFRALIRHPDNVYQERLSETTMIIVDNWRLLHSRTQIKGPRTVASCYMPRNAWVAAARNHGLYPS